MGWLCNTRYLSPGLWKSGCKSMCSHRSSVTLGKVLLPLGEQGPHWAPRAQGQSLVVTTGIRSFPRVASPICNENCFLQTQGNEHQVELKAVFPVPFWTPLSCLDMRHVNNDQTKAMEAPELGRAWMKAACPAP